MRDSIRGQNTVLPMSKRTQVTLAACIYMQGSTWRKLATVAISLRSRTRRSFRQYTHACVADCECGAADCVTPFSGVLISCLNLISWQFVRTVASDFDKGPPINQMFMACGWLRFTVLSSKLHANLLSAPALHESREFGTFFQFSNRFTKEHARKGIEIKEGRVRVAGADWTHTSVHWETTPGVQQCSSVVAWHPTPDALCHPDESGLKIESVATGGLVKLSDGTKFSESSSPWHLLDIIRKGKQRVVIVIASQDDRHEVATVAQGYEMTSNWAWIIIDNMFNDELAVQNQNINDVLQGWISIIRTPTQPPALRQFYEQVEKHGQQHFQLNISSVDPHAVRLYDAIYLFAHAATHVLANKGAVSNGTAIVEAMANVSFKGIADRTVQLDSNGDAVESYSLMNYVEGTEGGGIQAVEVGTYESGKLKLRVEDIRWPGNTTQKPQDTAGPHLHRLTFV